MTKKIISILILALWINISFAMDHSSMDMSQNTMDMTHPGLAQWAIWSVYITMFIFSLRLIWQPFERSRQQPMNFAIWSFVQNPWLLFVVRLIFAGLFLLIIYAGIFGTPIAERNIATVFTWNLWWGGLILSIFFLGSAWCAICPWNAISNWIVKRTLWRRSAPTNSLNLSTPKWLRSVWPALIFFVVLTWLELGLGITLDPYATALVSLFMVLFATVSLSVFKRNAFCRYLCPVGRTVGFYAQLSATALRPIDTNVCANCKTYECYHGSDKIEPCPTGLVMGTLTQNTYCTSCGNCTQSCPKSNVSWSLRSPSVEAISGSRPHWDEAWFMITLLALTALHGLTMMSFWEDWMNNISTLLNDSGQMLMSFSIGLIGVILFITIIYSVFVKFIQKLSKVSFKEVFISFAFINLALAFSYHMAHNLNHLILEGSGLVEIISNPLGTGTIPLSMLEKHERMTLWLSRDILTGLQAMLMIFGYWVAVKVIRYRSVSLGLTSRLQILPILFYIAIVTSLFLWMLAQPMIMRM
ncbi:MAG TPA: 4Fe-4S binding protein [Candidatus Thioglobus sp.]|jgi:polyferredoxin|nr:4Fe-4S binding protein [Candidatus Thioglobus sp.]